MGFFPQLRPARPAMELQRAVWERERPPKMAARPRAEALEGDSGLGKRRGAARAGLALARILPALPGALHRSRHLPVSEPRGARVGVRLAFILIKAF